MAPPAAAPSQADRRSTRARWPPGTPTPGTPTTGTATTPSPTAPSPTAPRWTTGRASRTTRAGYRSRAARGWTASAGARCGSAR
ncbi:hypothetical protein DMP17_23915 [Pseudonocardia sp. TMWB2A]